MPTYVYQCRECQDRLEVVQKMSDAPLQECGSCGGHLRRVLFPPAVVYKGSGFYTTDYRNGGRKPESESTPSEKPAPEASKSTSTDAAPAASAAD